MGSYKIRRLPLSQNIIDILEKNNFLSCKDVLSITKLELQAMLGINESKLNEILYEMGKKIVSEPKTIYELCKHQELIPSNNFLSLSLHSLDLLLQGGLPFGSITEFAGPPGVGKTQFSFMLSILTALPLGAGGLQSNVVYIDTESAFSAERIKMMAQKRFLACFKNSLNLAELLQRILVHKASSVNTLKEIISALEEKIIRNKVKLIIVDSIASLIRKEFGAENMESLVERNRLLMEQAAALKDLAQSYNLVVFLTNQITSQVADVELPFDACEENDDYVKMEEVAAAPAHKRMKLLDHVTPALGNTWSHCVNTRLVGQFVTSSTRQLTIAKSPIAPNASVHYTLEDEGIVLTDDDIVFVNMAEEKNRTVQTKYNFLTSEVTGTGTVFTATVKE